MCCFMHICFGNFWVFTNSSTLQETSGASLGGDSHQALFVSTEESDTYLLFRFPGVATDISNP